jgi:hypothetical protein
MSLIDDLKTNRDTQIMAFGIAFFLLAFPGYFAYASTNTPTGSFSSLGPVGNYSIEGTFEYFEIGSGSEYIEDGSEITVGAHSDAAGLDGDNIVGVRLTFEHTDDEASNGPTCIGVQDRADDLTISMTKGEFMTDGTGSESPLVIESYWINNSIVGTNVSNMSEEDVNSQLEGGDTGLGSYNTSMMVMVNKGSRTGCNTVDDGETIDYKIEIVTLTYTVTKVD